MAITEKSIKLLWSNAAGICSFNGCNEKLSVEEAAEVAPYTLGEMAHIKGKRPGSNRYDEAQCPHERDSYQNLILLCPTHHSLIDKPENEERFNVEALHRMKRAHESYISNQLTGLKYENIEQVKDKIAICLAENAQVWRQYGPQSENARKYPYSKEYHALWTSARIATIVPNNRMIVNVLTRNRVLFDRVEQRTVSKFINHAQDYERWVNDEIHYQTIQRFPAEFERLILGE